MATKEAEWIAQRQLDAYNGQDLKSFAACYAEDVRLMRFPGGEVVTEGREALKRRYGDLFRREPGRKALLLSRISCGRFVVDHEKVTSAPGVPPKYAMAIYEVDDGLIRRAWFPPPSEAGPGR